MASIQIDETTARLLEQRADALGLTVNDYLKSLLPVAPDAVRGGWEEIERAIDALSTEGSSLPDDFSRADIYSGHD